MENKGFSVSSFGLENHGLQEVSTAYWNLGPAQLTEEALKRGEGQLAANGSLVAQTGQYTGRSPGDRFIVSDASTEETIDWGPINQAISPDHFDRLLAKIQDYLKGREVFVQDCFGGAALDYALPIRTVHELAWHSLFAHQLFVRPLPGSTVEHIPELTVLYAPGAKADPKTDGTRSEAFIVLNLARKMVIIGGTRYAGEMKKSVFTTLNYLLPNKKVFPMHCSANEGADGDVALFFGLSGTGKTTLSADPKRRLIGDDEHGWSDDGIFNFEGGCYAKCINLSQENEPQIWNAIRFGSVVENVALSLDSRALDFDDDSITENTRCAYPVDFIDNAQIPSIGGHPSNVVFLTADAFGVLPPISRLTPEQAMYHFLSGYTAKVAGTERGLGSEPTATFSTGFGAPFLPRPPALYAEMLGDCLRRHKAHCWLVNTGWIGGAFGVGHRVSLPHTRAMLTAALSGDLNKAGFTPHPVFRVAVPNRCPGVPDENLDARGMWPVKQAYDEAAKELAKRFHKNFEKFIFAPEEICAAGPLK